MKNHFVAKRFPIRQKDKMRPIDDFSVCGVKATVGLPEKLRVESLDQVVAIILSMMCSKQALSGLPWTGRTFDLKAAYKRFRVRLDESNRLKIAIKSGQNDVSFYNVLALPFGATGSVVAFLRIAAALSFIGTRGLLICWSIFFDDFTAVAPEKVAGNTQLYIEFLFRLLGVNFSAEGDKAPPFAPLSNRLECSLTWTELDEVLFLLVIRLQGEASCWST